MPQKIKLDETREELIPKALKNIDAKVAVEVGVFKAQFSRHIMENWDGKLWMIDPWRELADSDGYIDASNHGLHGDVWKEAMQNISGFENRALMLRGLSSQMVDLFEDESIDMVYIDGNHAYKWVKEDIELWWPKLRKGGVLAGHDYLDMNWYEDPNFADNGKDKHIWMHPEGGGEEVYGGLFGVNPAVDEFCEEMNLTLVLTREWLGTWAIEKN